jgi:hypothetical protein
MSGQPEFWTVSEALTFLAWGMALPATDPRANDAEALPALDEAWERLRRAAAAGRVTIRGRRANGARLKRLEDVPGAWLDEEPGPRHLHALGALLADSTAAKRMPPDLAEWLDVRVLREDVDALGVVPAPDTGAEMRPASEAAVERARNRVYTLCDAIPMRRPNKIELPQYVNFLLARDGRRASDNMIRRHARPGKSGVTSRAAGRKPLDFEAFKASCFAQT